MWKPGTFKPSQKQSDASNNGAPDKSPKQGDGDGGGSAKKLSSSTMGMRFMQRKNVQSKEADEKKEVMQHAARRKSADNTASNGGSINRGEGASASDRKRDSMEISSNTEHSTTSDGVIILELASVTDMYGVGSDIVGRRSFGGFHKSVRSTWDAALKRRTDNARTKNTRAHITDEELLERYEKYVKGGGRSSGNRGRKEKRKRNSRG
ncbi:hypothetical protein ACHAXT_007163 [Thalassiosira profunda]